MTNDVNVFGEIYFTELATGKPGLKLGVKIKLGEISISTLKQHEFELWEKVNESSIERFFQKNFNPASLENFARAKYDPTLHFRIIHQEEYENEYTDLP